MTMEMEVAEVAPKDAPVVDHDCPYRNHAESVRKRGLNALNAFARLGSGVERTIAAVHADGECPPTHPGGDMTKPGREWADFVQTYQDPRDVIQ